MLFLFGVVIILIILLRIGNGGDSFWKHIMAIPGPRGLPIIGTAYYFDSSEEVFNRERRLMKEYYPIYKRYAFNTALVNIIQPDDIHMVLSNSKQNGKSKFYELLQDWIGLGILTSKDEMWHKRRKLLTPAFHFKILEKFLETFNKETGELVDYIKKECHRPYIDVVKPVTNFTLMSIGESSFGKDLRNEPDCDQYLQAVHDYGEHFIHRLSRPWLFVPFLYNLTSLKNEHDKTLKILHNFSEKLIKEREKNYQNKNLDDINKKHLILLDLMLEAKYNGAQIDDGGIKDEVNGFVFGGHDTTGVGLCHCLLLLANEPNIQEEIYQEIVSICQNPNSPTLSNFADMRFLDRCVKECLRIFPSIPAISRLLGEEIKTKSGFTIPKGQKYATIELKAALCGIIKNFKMIAITKPDEMRHKADIVLRPACEIRIKFVPRM
ncbi:cytochrome P450 4C1-like isoform X2 [Diorhabda carinulata]|uniref:cytochrome P450 4C1-like isoform X2 n=1 Tax=Diorhabda carinulata TaxID=1163345 RepID=UPI0025A0A467|nr:cytochrome P450 4C1-like isoform X2 [Diorhabda carinulata]